jgi:Bacterial capsule synthesis protein PGA_cap
MTVRIGAVGDVNAFHSEPECAYEYAGPVLGGMDVVFGQNERHYSDRTGLVPVVGFTEITARDHARSLQLGHFDVLSCASNHCLDLGPDVMLETIDVLEELGIAVIGAGADIARARRPAIVERDGLRIAFLAYCSVLRTDFEAGPESAGAAPLRAYTHYRQTDYQPGTDPQILTFPYADDLAALIADIEDAKRQADVVAVSVHWGIHLVKGVLADYERAVAHAAIDAGADVILGHGPHVLKGVEVYRGKPVFYSLGNFAFDQPREILQAGMARSAEFRALIERHHAIRSETPWDEYYASYAVTPATRLSMIAHIDVDPTGVRRAAFRPVGINTRAQPVPARAGDDDFVEVVDYVVDSSRMQGMATRFTIEGDDVVVDLGALPT